MNRMSEMETNKEINDLITSQIQLKVLEVINANENKLIKDLVYEVLNKDEGSGWRSKPFLDATINQYIKDLARQVVHNTLEEKRPVIEDEIKKRLDAKFFDKLIGFMSTGLSERLEIEFKLKDIEDGI